jgi:hypothetical protein
MIYSPHTFELSLILDTDKFCKLQNSAYDKSKGKYRVYQKNDVLIDCALLDEGIKIEYHDKIYKKKIKFIVNPTKALGGNDVKKLWKPNNDNILKLLHKLEKHIDDYFDSKYELDKFTLTRIDFTVNIDVEKRKNVSAYIKVLRNIGKVKGFAPKYDKNDERINPDLSFDFKWR